jgi:hypothetical protein
VSRRIVRVDAFDREAAGVFRDENALTAAGIEHARPFRQAIEPAPDRLELREIRRVIVPGRIGLAVIVAPLGVLAGTDEGAAAPSDRSSPF